MARRSKAASTSRSSLSFPVLLVGGLAVLAVVTGRADRLLELLPRLLPLLIPLLIPLALLVAAFLIARKVWHESLPMRATRQLMELRSGDAIRGEKLANKPLRLVWARREPHGWSCWWFFPPDMSASDTNSPKNREVIQREVGVTGCSFRTVYLKLPLVWWRRHGLVKGRFGTHPVPELLPYTEAYSLPAPAGSLQWCVGSGPFGTTWADLAALPHLVGGGETRGGKSSALTQQLVYLCETHAPEELQLVLIDLKRGTTLNTLEPLPHCDRFGMARTAEEANLQLKAVISEMHRRFDQLDQAGRRIKTLDDYNLLPGRKPWSYIVVTVDEGYVLPQKGEEAEMLGHVASQGGAVGIHLVTFTQRPDADTVHKRVLANSPAVLAFHCATDWNSGVLLGNGVYTAHRELPSPDEGGKGLAVWKWGTDPVVLRTPWLSPEEAMARVDALMGDREWDGKAAREARFDALRRALEAAGTAISNGRRPDSLKTPPQRGSSTTDVSVAHVREALVDPWPAREGESEHQRYQRYLRDPESPWQAKREMVIQRAEGRCERGREKGHDAPVVDVHHQSYRLKYREPLGHLLGVCRECHDYLEGLRDDDPAAAPARV